MIDLKQHKDLYSAQIRHNMYQYRQQFARNNRDCFFFIQNNLYQMHHNGMTYVQDNFSVTLRLEFIMIICFYHPGPS